MNIEEAVEVTKLYCEAIDPFMKASLGHITPDNMQFIEKVINAAQVLADPAYEIPPQYVIAMVISGHVLGNVFAMAGKTTDDLLSKTEDPVKQMVLYSARNETKLPMEPFFDNCVAIASIWAGMFAAGVAGYTNQAMAQRIDDHLTQLDNRYVFNPASLHLYRHANILGRLDIIDKLNKATVECSPVIENEPNGSIAIVTDRWGSSGYEDVVTELAKTRKVVLLSVAKVNPTLDVSLFTDVLYITFNGGNLDLSSLVGNNFSAVVFLDPLDQSASIGLANCRIAPVQIAMQNQMSGSCIDFTFTDRPLVLPNETPTKNTDEAKLVNMLGGVQKYTMVPLLIAKSTTLLGATPVFYPGRRVHQSNITMPFLQDMGRLFGKTVKILPHVSHENYLSQLSQAQFSLDAWPIGCYNSVVESLYVGCPVVTVKGSLASDLLHKNNMDELVADDLIQMQKISDRLLSDSPFLDEMRLRASQVTLQPDSHEFAERILEHVK